MRHKMVKMHRKMARRNLRPSAVHHANALRQPMLRQSVLRQP